MKERNPHPKDDSLVVSDTDKQRLIDAYTNLMDVIDSLNDTTTNVRVEVTVGDRPNNPLYKFIRVSKYTIDAAGWMTRGPKEVIFNNS